MTKMQSHQATSVGRQNPGLVDRTYIVGSRPLKVDSATRMPGELIPEARDWLPQVRRIHLDLGWLEEVKLVTDDERQAFAQQWDQERRERFEATKQAAQAPKPTPVPAPAPPPMLTVACANCKRKNTFDHEIGNAEWWRCSHCGQNQTGEQSRRGTLQLLNVPGAHAVNHNRQPSYWDGGSVS
jgi:hypothetical protein